MRLILTNPSGEIKSVFKDEYQIKSIIYSRNIKCEYPENYLEPETYKVLTDSQISSNCKCLEVFFKKGDFLHFIDVNLKKTHRPF